MDFCFIDSANVVLHGMEERCADLRFRIIGNSIGERTSSRDRPAGQFIMKRRHLK